MNLTRILAFHRVAVAGSFTLAARLSGVSQPTLSAQVRSLERFVGVPLFDRIGRLIELTPHGEELFGATTRLSAALDDVGGVLHDQQGNCSDKPWTGDVDLLISPVIDAQLSRGLVTRAAMRYGREHGSSRRRLGRSSG